MIDQQLSAIFAGADAAAYSVPAEWDAARKALDALEGRRRQASIRLNTERDRARKAPATRAAALVDLAAHGKLEATEYLSTPILEAEEAEKEATADLAVIAHACTLATDALRRRVARDADQFIVDHLRPALTETLDRVRDAAPHLADVRVEDPGALAKADKQQRDAYMATAEAAVRYEAVRDAQQGLYRIAGRPFTVHAQARDKERWPGLRGTGRPMWPAGPVAGMLALVKAQVWLPTQREQIEDERERGRALKEAVKSVHGSTIPVIA